MIVLIAAGTGVLVLHLRDRALAEKERELQNVASAVAGKIDLVFRTLSLVEIGLIERLRASGIKSAIEFEQKASGRDTRLMLERKIAELPFGDALTLIGPQGKTINHSRSWPPLDMDVSDKDFFLVLKADPLLTSYMSEPVRNGANGQWTVYLVHKFVSQSGEFVGLVLGAIETRHFEEYFATLSLGEGGIVTLDRRDGALLAGHRHVGRASATSNGRPALFMDVSSKSDAGDARFSGIVGDLERLTASQPLADYPAVVSVGVTLESVFGPWRKTTIYLTIAAVVVVFVIAGAIFLGVWQVGKRLGKQNTFLDAALNNMSQGLVMMDSEGRLVVCNDRYIQMYGLVRESIKPGCTVRDLVARRQQAGTFSGDPDAYVTEILTASAQGKPYAREMDFADGRTVRIANRLMPGGGWVTTHEDITERKQAEQQIAHMARHDMLTGLSNRAQFCEELDRAIGRVQRGERLAVLYIDLDHFKRVNDTLGHLMGDELLRQTAVRLRACIRETDLIARLGGDEFAILQTSIGQPSDAAALATRIGKALKPPFDLDGNTAVVGASIGISIAPDDAVEQGQLLKNADLALYGAKGNGRGTYHFYELELDNRMKARQKLESDLRDALTNGEFELYYQPVVDLRTNDVNGCEALLRWHHPERGLVAPAEFIPVAEESGIITPLGEWVLQQACADAACWPEHMHVAINLSPIQLKSGKLVPLVMRSLAATGMSARRLELEITETVLMQNTFSTLATLHQLHDIGVRIAMDDFGTGYSSLSYLRSFPFDKIKIDRSFIENISENDGCVTIVQSITSMAHRLGMKTIAEGIETEDQRTKVQELGCDEMQGYLFSRPRPIQEVVRLFDTGAERAASAA